MISNQKFHLKVASIMPPYANYLSNTILITKIESSSADITITSRDQNVHNDFTT
jgi:hypothetical protein